MTHTSRRDAKRRPLPRVQAELGRTRAAVATAATVAALAAFAWLPPANCAWFTGGEEQNRPALDEWILGAPGASCTLACGAKGLTCDARLRADLHNADAAVKAFTFAGAVYGCDYKTPAAETKYSNATHPLYYIPAVGSVSTAGECQGYEDVPEVIDCDASPPLPADPTRAALESYRRLCKCVGRSDSEFANYYLGIASAPCSATCSVRGRTCSSRVVTRDTPAVFEALGVDMKSCAPGSAPVYESSEQPALKLPVDFDSTRMCVGWKSVAYESDCLTLVGGASRVCHCPAVFLGESTYEARSSALVTVISVVLLLPPAAVIVWLVVRAATSSPRCDCRALRSAVVALAMAVLPGVAKSTWMQRDGRVTHKAVVLLGQRQLTREQFAKHVAPWLLSVSAWCAVFAATSFLSALATRTDSYPSGYHFRQCPNDAVCFGTFSSAGSSASSVRNPVDCDQLEPANDVTCFTRVQITSAAVVGAAGVSYSVFKLANGVVLTAAFRVAVLLPRRLAVAATVAIVVAGLGAVAAVFLTDAAPLADTLTALTGWVLLTGVLVMGILWVPVGGKGGVGVRIPRDAGGGDRGDYVAQAGASINAALLAGGNDSDGAERRE